MNDKPLPMLNGFPAATDRARLVCDILGQVAFTHYGAQFSASQFLDGQGIQDSE